MLIILLSTYLPQTIGLYVTIILGLGADVYSLILTMGLVGSFLLLIWRLKKKKMLFIFEKKELELVICLLLICNLCGLSDSR